MQKKPRQTKKNNLKADESHSKMQVLPNTETATFLSCLEEAISNRETLFLLLFVGLAVGISTQLNWVQLKCENANFFTNEPAYCRHNLLRLVLGGPLTFLLLWIVVSFLRWRNNRLSLTYLTRIQFLLIPFVIVPFIQNSTVKALLANMIIIIYLLALLMTLRKDIGYIFREVADFNSLRIKTKIENGAVRLSLIGRLSPEEAEWATEAFGGIAVQLKGSRQKVVADVSRLEGYQKDYAYIFVILLGVCASQNCSMTIVGAQQLCRQIQEDLLRVCQTVGHSSHDLKIIRLS